LVRIFVSVVGHVIQTIRSHSSIGNKTEVSNVGNLANVAADCAGGIDIAQLLVLRNAVGGRKAEITESELGVSVVGDALHALDSDVHDKLGQENDGKQKEHAGHGVKHAPVGFKTEAKALERILVLRGSDKTNLVVEVSGTNTGVINTELVEDGGQIFAFVFALEAFGFLHFFDHFSLVLFEAAETAITEAAAKHGEELCDLGFDVGMQSHDTGAGFLDFFVIKRRHIVLGGLSR